MQKLTEVVICRTDPVVDPKARHIKLADMATQIEASRALLYTVSGQGRRLSGCKR